MSHRAGRCTKRRDAQARTRDGPHAAQQCHPRKDVPCESISKIGIETIPPTPDEFVGATTDKTVHDEDDDVLHFLVGGVKLRFGLGKFAVIPGLKCKGSVSIKLRNNFPNEDERVILDLDGLTFEITPMASQSQHLSDEFFYTQAPKRDIGWSICGDGEPSNANLRRSSMNFGFMDDNQDEYKVIPDSNLEVYEFHRGGEKTDIAKDGVDIAESM
ncbi:hypothetical protein HAX54_025534 [Datura stramonium]|uniref:Uncharacterized protein n=1 Tax=Datura stramonium TaxID=4076 RepID=A0ABS8RKB7_DATST|nr:hypothetical protein [Datura stramonium]